MKLKIFEQINKAKIDKENGWIDDVVIMSSVSSNNRFYTAPALQSAAQKLNGRPAFFGHGGGARDIKKDLIGNFSDLRIEKNKLLARLNVLEKEQNFVFEIAEKMPDVAGFSLDADVAGHYDERGCLIVDEFNAGHSVDLVTNPATTKSIFEEKQRKETGEMELVELEKKVRILEETAKEKGEKLEAAQKKIRIMENKAKAEKKIAASGIGEYITAHIRESIESDIENADVILDEQKKIIEKVKKSVLEEQKRKRSGVVKEIVAAGADAPANDFGKEIDTFLEE